MSAFFFGGGGGRPWEVGRRGRVKKEKEDPLPQCLECVDAHAIQPVM